LEIIAAQGEGGAEGLVQAQCCCDAELQTRRIRPLAEIGFVSAAA